MPTMTWTDFQETIEQLPFFGAMLMEVSPIENGGNTIHIWDEEQAHTLDGYGDVIKNLDRKVTKLATFCVNEQGIIQAFDPLFSPFSPFLHSFIGTAITDIPKHA